MERPAPSTSHQIAATRLTPRGETGPTICFAAFAGQPWLLVLMMSLIAIVGVVSYFAFLIFLIGWQVHQVEEFCKKMLPGTPVAKIRPAIEKHRPWNGLVAHQLVP